MKRIILVMSLIAMVAFLTAPAAAGPNSLSDNEMDTVYAKGIEITGTGTVVPAAPQLLVPVWVAAVRV